MVRKSEINSGKGTFAASYHRVDTHMLARGGVVGDFLKLTNLSFVPISPGSADFFEDPVSPASMILGRPGPTRRIFLEDADYSH